MNVLNVGVMLDSLIPITRFNKGEASKIFDEVKKSGCKIVVKNNVPTCVLLTPEKYQEMLEYIENQYLISIASEREGEKTYSQAEVLEEFGLTEEELEEIEVEID